MFEEATHAAMSSRGEGGSRSQKPRRQKGERSSEGGSGGRSSRSRRQKGEQQLFGEDETQLQRPDAPPPPAILKAEAPPPAFKIMGGGIDTQRKDQTPLRVTARFLDEELNVYTDELGRHLSEHPDFTVIGVLGFQGAGKSRVLSELCGYRREATADGRSALIGTFSEQTEDELLEGLHHTCGVDACVNVAEQLILLDVQPLLSASLLVQRMRQRRNGDPLEVGRDRDRGAPADGPDTTFTSHENQLEMESLTLAVWLLSVCHVVLVVSEQGIDLGLVQLLQTALMLQQRLADAPRLLPAAGGGSGGQHHVAQLNFVMNKCGHECWRQETQSQLQKLLDGVFGGSAQADGSSGEAAAGDGHVQFDLLPVGSPIGPGEQPQGGGGAGGAGGVRGAGGRHPGPRGANARGWRGGASGDVSYGVAVKQWREGLLRRLPQRGFSSAVAGADREAAAAAARERGEGSSAGPSSKPMSEREWLRAASRLWTAVRLNGNCAGMADTVAIDQGLAGYNAVLQRMGWQPDGPEQGRRRHAPAQQQYDQRDVRYEEGAEQLSRPRDRDARDSRISPGLSSTSSSEALARAANGREARLTRKTAGGGAKRDPSEYDPRDVRYRPP